eukprot:TRINITY_DN15133_c0_g1_i1.p1 TRINITY_DN15133_c0_g1~~TRINITY_DN15133_c0_g1_i1.p1  ORF type:complete len:277 (+),score=89.10 TRINITY_DN15133_c0_g1_i1:88-918(+)
MAEHAGYWGPVTASVDWCEENYEVTFYVAEFFNTASSVLIALAGLYALRRAAAEQRGVWLHAAAVSTLVIGIGSAAFHGTLTRGGQLLDELPMMWGSCTFLAATIASHGRLLAARRTRVISLIYTWAAAATWLYFAFGFEAFIVMYSVTVACVVLASYHAARTPAHPQRPNAANQTLKKQLAGLAAGVYVAGFALFWIPEQVVCGNRLERTDARPGVARLQLHAWFHIMSAVGPYIFLVFLAVLEVDAEGETGRLAWTRPVETLGVVPVPVVVVVA